MFETIDRIVVKVSDACNLDCKYCFEKGKMGRGRFTDWKGLSSFIKGLKSNQWLIVKFMGGEPLLFAQDIQDGIQELRKIERVKDVSILFGTTTNGTIISPLVFLLEQRYFQPGFVNISWDGVNAETKNSTEILNYMKRFADDVIFRVALDPKLIDELAYNMMILDKAGFKSKEYYLLDGVDYSDPDFLNSFRYQIAYMKDNDITTMNEDNIHIVKDLGYNNYHVCGHIDNILYVDANGDLYPCGMFSQDGLMKDNKFCIGSIYSGLDKEKCKWFESIYDIPHGECDDCENKHCWQCQALCMYENKSFSYGINRYCQLKSIEREIFLAE